MQKQREKAWEKKSCARRQVDMSDILKDVRSHCGSSQTVNVNLLVIPHIFCGYSVGYQSGQFISSCIYRNSVSWFNLSPYRSCHCHAIYMHTKKRWLFFNHRVVSYPGCMAHQRLVAER